MKLTQFAVALTAAASQATLALANQVPTPPLPAWYPLKPWSISSLTTRHPRNRPYDTSASSMVLTITNPGQIPAVPAPHASGGGYVVFRESTAVCELHWKTDDFTPYGRSTNSCVVAPATPADTYSNPQWTVTLNEVHTELGNPDYSLSLSFQLVHNATIYATRGYKLMTGGLSLDSDRNLDGQCADGDNGLCEYRLRDAATPLQFQSTLQECKSACG